MSPFPPYKPRGIIEQTTYPGRDIDDLFEHFEEASDKFTDGLREQIKFLKDTVNKQRANIKELEERTCEVCVGEKTRIAIEQALAYEGHMVDCMNHEYVYGWMHSIRDTDVYDLPEIVDFCRVCGLPKSAHYVEHSARLALPSERKCSPACKTFRDILGLNK